jgi:hypothetical protein
MKKLGTYVYKKYSKDELYINDERIDLNAFLDRVYFNDRLYSSIKEVLGLAFDKKIDMIETKRNDHEIYFDIMCISQRNIDDMKKDEFFVLEG